MSTTTKAPTPTELALSQIALHPHNVRMKVSVDAEFVKSIKARIIEPLVVAPFPVDGDFEQQPDQHYVLIAGHRRLAAARKAKLATVPVRVLEDLTSLAEQVETMLEENTRRTDLSAIEEGDAYLFLMDHGRTQQQIADRVHRDKRTIASRVKIARLTEPVRKKVHAHQITIDAAMAIAEFGDDPQVQKRLIKEVGGYGFESTLRELRNRRREARERAKKRKGLEQAGVPVLDEAPPRTAGDDPWVELPPLFADDKVQEAVDRAVCEHRGVEYSPTANDWADVEAWHQETCAGHAVILQVTGSDYYTRETWTAICRAPGVHAELLAVDVFTGAGDQGSADTAVAVAAGVVPGEEPQGLSGEQLQATRRDQQVAAIATDRWAHVSRAVVTERWNEDTRDELARSVAAGWDFQVQNDDTYGYAVRGRLWQATLLGLTDPETATSADIKEALKQFRASASLSQLVLMKELWTDQAYSHGAIDRGGWPASSADLVRLVTDLGWEWTNVELTEIRSNPKLAKAAGESYATGPDDVDEDDLDEDGAA